ncbi:MAG: arylesterase [Gemmatimonadetes bacterium]|nr:arylesterase [Gemmatimonadota bacterium]
MASIMVRRKILAGVFLALAIGCGPGAGGRERPMGERQGVPGVVSGSAVLSDRPAIVFLGTSLTAGRGLPSDQAFPALIRDTLEALGIDFRVVNAGVSGQTSAGGLRRIDWLLRQPIGVLVLELGANDGLRGLNVAMLRSNLQAIIDQTKREYPAARIVILGMEAPPNLGRFYTAAFQKVFPEIARANDAALVPFLLDSVAGIAELNQPDGIHPTARGHRILARNVWRVLEGVVLAGSREQ